MKTFYPGSLHNHDEFSNLRLRDSISRIDELCEYALELGHEVIAITDHETVANAVKIEKTMKKYPDLKIIRGNEIYLVRDGLTKNNFSKDLGDRYFHFILLAKDLEGHRQLRELSTRAWLRSWMNGKMRRVPTYYQDLIDIVGAAPGHIIGSTACLGSFLGTKLLQYRQTEDRDFYAKIQQWLRQMNGLFGDGNFFLEMQPSANPEQKFVNRQILKLSKELNIPYIITTDSHYTRKEDAPIHKAFLNAQDGDREISSFYATTYMMGTEELENYMNDYMTEDFFEEAYSNIRKIKDMCEDYSIKKELKIPTLMWRIPSEQSKQYVLDLIDKIPMIETFINSDFEGDYTMVRLMADKIMKDKSLQNQEAYDELNKNLESVWISSQVNKAHWSAYFLNLQYTLDVCWEAGTLVGPGRGSGVGFLLLYALDIIQINKMRENTETYHWRFLNPDRVSPLDIDTDIEGGRRAEVLAKLREVYGEDRVAGVTTFGTEGSKSAIQTAARGLGLDNDLALYIASLIPADRGQVRSLKQCFYGDKEKGFAPIPLFIQQMQDNPELWKVAQKIEGLICRSGIHAGGIIFVDEPFTNSTALMRAPSGDIVTQFDLHDAEQTSLIKIDLLSTECWDKVHVCLDLLIEFGYIKPEATLKETYDKYLNIYTIERNDPKMWEMVHKHQIQSLFQMEQASGIQGIELIKPTSVDELAVLNSVIRLMNTEKGGEQPLDMWARYRKNIKEWIIEMKRYGLTEGEIAWLSNHPSITNGICESQEGLMSLVQEERLGGNSLGFADKCRKGLAKKIGAIFDECEKEFYDNIDKKGCSIRLAHYVWDVLLRVQRGYSFNRSHTLAYSLVALQEMNLAYKYPIIFWNTACLITDSGGTEKEVEDETKLFDEDDIELNDNEEEKKKKPKSVDYKKIATAIGKMQQTGITIEPPDINKSNYTFTPNVKENKITYGLSGISYVGEDVINTTITGRPYVSIKDFYERVKPKRQAMISLIRGGAFDSLMDRKEAMAWFIWETCDKKQRLTLQNMPGLIKYELLPTEGDYLRPYSIYEFTRYLKKICKTSSKEIYKLDNRAIDYLTSIEKDSMINEDMTLSAKSWDNIYQKEMNVFRDWINMDKENILKELNYKIFKMDWDKYVKKMNLSAWEMMALSFYYHEHELKDVNKNKYGIVNFFDLPESPEVSETFVIKGRVINKFYLHKIVGTCIAKNKNKGTVVLLTPEGVVNVKMHKEAFSYYDKQISRLDPTTGKKKVIQRSWLNKGEMIMVHGFRSGDNFIPKKYKSSSVDHTVFRIEDITKEGDLILRTERAQGIEEEDNGEEV